jgi:TRAP-type C4-dicarboxylate transport system substrate-binding protein
LAPHPPRIQYKNLKSNMEKGEAVKTIHSRFTSSVRAAALAVAALFGTGVQAQEVTLRLVSAFPENISYTTHVMPWIKQFNKQGSGLVQISFIGGPKAIPTFEVGNAVKTGVVDMALSNSSYYASLMPEADALKLIQISVAEQRRNGAFDYINKVWNEKANMVYYARYIEHVRFHAYVNKKVTRPDLTGLKMRVHPAYRDFFAALGAVNVTIAPGELHTALDRGVVDGHGMTNVGIFELNLQDKTKYRIDPGFYDVESAVIINLGAWNKLTAAQRDFMRKQALALEAQNIRWKTLADEEFVKQAQIGIQTITFDPATAKQYYDKAYEVGWANFVKASPVHGPRMRQLFSK